MSNITSADQINAEPTKAFFVDMLTRDIALEQAILDLVDNSVDGAKAFRTDGALPFEGRCVQILFNKEMFRILDNCGGFDSETAKNYAFRFGRPSGSPRTPHSIGQFGVGMKRALFKFGNHFLVRSSTQTNSWAVDVEVPTWEQESGWHFPWATFEEDGEISKAQPGTEIIVTNLRPEVGRRFETKMFENSILGLIKSKHRQFISEGLSITVNGKHVDATSLYLLVKDQQFLPGTDEIIFEEEGTSQVKVRIVVGVGHSSPREAGWYVVCNGRVVLESDRSGLTGWGLIEEHSDSVVLPNYHNQFARFRGIVSFDSDDSSRVPWNTTKTDVDQDNQVWQQTFRRMTEMMRPVISFLNELDSDIDEYTRADSPLLDFVIKAESVKLENLPVRAEFKAPARGTIVKGPKVIKIQYSRPVDQVDYLMKELSLTSAKAVGERAFDLTFQRMGGE